MQYLSSKRKNTNGFICLLHSICVALNCKKKPRTFYVVRVQQFLSYQAIKVVLPPTPFFPCPEISFSVLTLALTQDWTLPLKCTFLFYHSFIMQCFSFCEPIFCRPEISQPRRIDFCDISSLCDKYFFFF